MRQKNAYLLLFLTFFLFSTVYVVGKIVSPYVPAALVVGIRCLVALLPLGLMSRLYWGTPIAKEDRKWFIVIGFLSYFLSPLMIQVAILFTGASMASLLNSMTPVAVTIFAVFMLGEKLTPAKVLCLLLAILGAVVITKGAGTQSQLLGIAAAIAAVLAYAAPSVMMRRLSTKYPAVLITFYGTAVSLLFHIPVSLWSAVSQPVTVNGTVILALLYLGIACSGLAQYTWAKSLSILPAVTCSLFYPLQPVFATVMGVLFLGESVTGSFLIGLVLISLDIVINILAENREKNVCQFESNQG